MTLSDALTNLEQLCIKRQGLCDRDSKAWRELNRIMERITLLRLVEAANQYPGTLQEAP